MLHAGSSLSEALETAHKYSLKRPDMYVTIFTCFGLFLQASKRLRVFSPSESLGGGMENSNRSRKSNVSQTKTQLQQ